MNSAVQPPVNPAPLRSGRVRFGLKLAVAIAGSSCAVLLVASIGMTLVEMHRNNLMWREDLASTAHMLGANSTASLAFRDQKAAAEVLSALEEKRWIEAGHLYDVDGKVFASYVAAEEDEALAAHESDHSGPAVLAKSELAEFIGFSKERGGHLQYVAAIVEGEHPLGYIHLIKSTGELREWVRQSTLIGLIALGLALLLTGLIAYALQRIMTKPIQALLATMQRVTSTGDYSARAQVQGRDEFAELGEGFNAMLDRVQNTDRKLASYNQQLEAEVAARTADLSLALDRAEAASRAKSQFLANMSHEIRTPLNGVVGMLRLLQESDLPATHARYVKTALESSDSLLHVINDILDFSKIEAGKLVLDNVDFDLEKTIESAVRLFSLSAHAKQLTLACHLDKTLPRFVRGDGSRVSQILANLLGNAIKFTDQGHVVVTARTESEDDRAWRICLEVTDTGLGISEAAMNLLFRAFSQVDGSSTRKHGGTGLGLAICRQLAELMGGGIGATSDVGRGSSFWVRLCLQKTKQAPEADEASVGRAHVLVVEPEAQVRRILTDYGIQLGCRVQAVETGMAAAAAVQQAAKAGAPFQIVISSRDFSRWSAGLAAETRGTRPVVLMTFPFGDEQARHEIEDAGVIPLARPVLRAEFRTALYRAMSRSAESAETVLHAEIADRLGRVLIAEDNEVNQMVATAVMEGMGFEVRCVANGREAVVAALTGQFDLVLMDCQMPEMDGYEATRAIRAAEAANGHAHLPIIALTAHAITGDRELCLAAGMDAYLTKPMDFDEARKVVMEITAGRQARTRAGHGVQPA